MSRKTSKPTDEKRIEAARRAFAARRSRRRYLERKRWSLAVNLVMWVGLLLLLALALWFLTR